MADIATNWKILSGEKNWEGLLDPIDDNLRQYLVNYGSLVGAAEDSFNDTVASDGYGLCQYPLDFLFTRVGLQNGNPFKYKVTDYLYASIGIDVFGTYLPVASNFIGFVAVSTDEGNLVLGRRDIVVCWRGTKTIAEGIEDFRFFQIEGTDIFPNSKALVHRGFHSVYTAKNPDSKYCKTSVRKQAQAAVGRLVDKYCNETVSITVAGHSLGGALATLNAADIVANGYNKPTGSTIEYPVTCFTFASPRVGDQGFLDVLSELKTFHLLSIKNALDKAPTLPPKDFNYVDVGVVLDIDTKDSPYIKKRDNNDYHELNIYLHGISGYQGKGKAFKKVDNYALVNKYEDNLLDSYKVPPKWWCNILNKGMVQMDYGIWKLDDYVPDPPSDDVYEKGTKY